jgi:hypothetical protein
MLKLQTESANAGASLSLSGAVERYFFLGNASSRTSDGFRRSVLVHPATLSSYDTFSLLPLSHCSFSHHPSLLLYVAGHGRRIPRREI